MRAFLNGAFQVSSMPLIYHQEETIRAGVKVLVDPLFLIPC